MARVAQPELLDEGTLSFTIESRLLRELGERLVKAPEVAVVELIKNAYDADASRCDLQYEPDDSITVSDDGVGMTLSRFKTGWMRIGTSSKAETPVSTRYGRNITGEKGIGRFAVRFLGGSCRSHPSPMIASAVIEPCCTRPLTGRHSISTRTSARSQCLTHWCAPPLTEPRERLCSSRNYATKPLNSTFTKLH